MGFSLPWHQGGGWWWRPKPGGGRRVRPAASSSSSAQGGGKGSYFDRVKVRACVSLPHAAARAWRAPPPSRAAASRWPSARAHALRTNTKHTTQGFKGPWKAGLTSGSLSATGDLLAQALSARAAPTTQGGGEQQRGYDPARTLRMLTYGLIL